MPTHFGEAIAAGRAGTAGSESLLIALAANADEPAIARATALGLLARRPSQTGMNAVFAALSDPDPTVHRHALAGLETIQAEQRLELASHLLSDPIRSIRIEAARLLMPNHEALRSGPLAQAFDAALDEYRDSMDALADRPGAHVGYGGRGTWN